MMFPNSICWRKDYSKNIQDQVIVSPSIDMWLGGCSKKRGAIPLAPGRLQKGLLATSQAHSSRDSSNSISILDSGSISKKLCVCVCM